ncbi:Uncharacterised protein [Mycobacterium tuberculosis]|nr:Uncharacterised protein [Mycobacterium tuberculosis]
MGSRLSQLSASDESEIPSPGPTMSASASAGRMR